MITTDDMGSITTRVLLGQGKETWLDLTPEQDAFWDEVAADIAEQQQLAEAEGRTIVFDVLPVDPDLPPWIGTGPVTSATFHQRGKHDQKSHGAWTGQYRELPPSGVQIKKSINGSWMAEGVFQNGAELWVGGTAGDRLAMEDVETIASGLKAADEAWPLDQMHTEIDVVVDDWDTTDDQGIVYWGAIRESASPHPGPSIFLNRRNMHDPDQDPDWRAGPQVDGRTTLQSTVVHEYAHVQEALIGRSDYPGHRPDMIMISTTSRYSRTNPHESLAENFSEFVYTDGKSEYMAVQAAAGHYGWGNRFGKRRSPMKSRTKPKARAASLQDVLAEIGEVAEQAFHKRGTHDQKSHGKWAGTIAGQEVVSSEQMTSGRGRDLVEKLTLADGSHVIKKTYGTSSVQDRDVVADEVAKVIDAPIAHIVDRGDNWLAFEYVTGESSGMTKTPPKGWKMREGIVDMEGSRELGLLDYTIDNTDRHGLNVRVTPGGSLVGIDHGQTFERHRFPSPFAARWIPTRSRGGQVVQVLPHDYTDAELNGLLDAIPSMNIPPEYATKMTERLRMALGKGPG